MARYQDLQSVPIAKLNAELMMTMTFRCCLSYVHEVVCQNFLFILLRGVQYISTSNLSLVHEIVDLLQFRQTDDLERCLD